MDYAARVAGINYEPGQGILVTQTQKKKKRAADQLNKTKMFYHTERATTSR
jgi:hypothetical protein